MNHNFLLIQILFHYIDLKINIKLTSHSNLLFRLPCGHETIDFREKVIFEKWLIYIVWELEEHFLLYIYKLNH